MEIKNTIMKIILVALVPILLITAWLLGKILIDNSDKGILIYLIFISSIVIILLFIILIIFNLIKYWNNFEHISKDMEYGKEFGYILFSFITFVGLIELIFYKDEIGIFLILIGVFSLVSEYKGWRRKNGS